MNVIGDLSPILIEKNAFGLLVSTIREGERDSKIQRACSTIIRNVAGNGVLFGVCSVFLTYFGSVEKAIELLYDLNGVENIVAMLSNYPSDELIQDNACCALVSFCRLGEFLSSVL